MSENINSNIDEDIDNTAAIPEDDINNGNQGDEEKNNVANPEQLQQELTSLKDDYDSLYDKYLRVSAEYENFRKRTAKEKENIYFESTIDVLKTLLPVLDNIERAMQFAETDKTEKIGEGLKMVYSQFMDSFERLGIKEIQAKGEKFNPEVHNAVFHEEDETQPENTIIEVLQKGYIKGERVVRPAMVKVVN